MKFKPSNREKMLRRIAVSIDQAMADCGAYYLEPDELKKLLGTYNQQLQFITEEIIFDRREVSGYSPKMESLTWNLDKMNYERGN